MAQALRGKLTVNVIEAQELRNTELIGKMDPYVKIQLGNEKFKTKVHKDGHKNPKWNQSFLFNLEGKEDIIHIFVMDKETFSDDTVGRADIQLRDFVSVRDTPRWFQLVEKDNFRKMAGKILMTVHFEGSGLPTENKAVSIPVQTTQSPSGSPPPYNPSSAPPAYNPSAPPPAYNPMAPSASPVLPPPTMVQSPPMYVPPPQPVMQPVMQQPVYQPQQQIYTQPPIQQQYQQYPPQQVTFQSPQPIVYTQPVFQSPPSTVVLTTPSMGMGMGLGLGMGMHHHHHGPHGGPHGGGHFGGHHGHFGHH